MLKRFLLAALLTALPGASAAGTLSVTFELSASTLGFAPSQSPLPTVTRAVSGQVVLTLTGVDANGMLLGSGAEGRLAGFALSATFGIPSGVPGFADTLIGSRFDFMQGPSASGAFDGTRLVLGSGLAGSVLTTRICTAPECLLIDFFGPESVRAPFDSGIGLALALGQLVTPGAATLMASLAFAARPDAAPLLQIRGTEVARGFASEPSAAGLLALALAALARSARLRR